jgi:eukaryotic-like serine/threonine-protein kinase
LQTFGDFRLIRPLATGGLWEVYLAEPARGGPRVALKLVQPSFAADEELVELLVEEAEIAARLDHPNVVQVLDLGSVGGVYYVAMEFIDGGDLCALLRRHRDVRGEFPLAAALYLMAEVCAGLDYAHHQRDTDGRPLGIVHRDVTPQNILLSRAGQVKIGDFGIAKAALRARQTEAGVVKGKSQYFSPEQAWGDPVDARSDLFSAGLVLYEVLTGEPPYRVQDPTLLIDLARHANIAPLRTRRDVPADVDAAVMRALRAEPDERHQDGAALRRDLLLCLEGCAPGFGAADLARLIAPDPAAAG